VLAKRWNNAQSYVQIVPFGTLYSEALTLAPSQFEGKDSVFFADKKSAVFTTQNLGNAYIYGFSANTKIAINTSLSLSASYTFTKGRVLDNNKETPLDHIPPTFGRIALDYQKEKLQLSLYSLFNGTKKTADYRLGTEDNELYSADAQKGFMPSWMTLNLRVGYQLGRNAEIQAGIENILDQHYRIFASGVSAAGRNVNVTLRFKI
jgi:hemoglobin/transferrin/lactoferrin receptor protein